MDLVVVAMRFAAMNVSMKQMLGVAAAIAMTAAPAPVSYTHLTLPTIYSV